WERSPWWTAGIPAGPHFQASARAGVCDCLRRRAGAWSCSRMTLARCRGRLIGAAMRPAKPPWGSAQGGVLRFLRVLDAGDFGDQLVQDRLAEGVEILCYHYERTGAADHVVAVIVVETAGRIGVIGVPRHRPFAQDDEAIDGHAPGQRSVARVGDIAA